MLRNITLNKGTYIKFQPHETAFIDLGDPKAILERELTNYATVFKGDTININHAGRDYAINVVDCKPNDQICVVEADINVEFDAPLDYVEPVRKPAAVAQQEKVAAKHADELEQKKEEI